MLIEDFGGGLFGFHGDEFVSFGLKTREDVSDNSSLHTIGLDHDVSTLHGHGESASRSDGGNTGGGSEGGGRRESIGRGGGDGSEKSGDLHCC